MTHVQISALLVSSCVALGASAAFGANASQDDRAATITKSRAQQIALANVPGASVQSAELEHEHGKLVWSFDIKDPKSPNVVELQVDARTGDIVHRAVETPADQAKEARADRQATRPR